MKRLTAVRGLAILAARIFFLWGALVAAKGLWDCFAGQPEANFFSPSPWMYVTKADWRRYAGFELTYGLACVGVGWALRRLSTRLPPAVEQEETENPLS